MASSGALHGRTTALLLISKLLDCRDNASPLTLIIDSAEQSAGLVIKEYLKRAESNKSNIIFVSFETLTPPQGVQIFIRAWDMNINALPAEIHKHTSSTSQRHLLIFDSVYPVLSTPNINPTSFLPPLITPSTTLVAVHHADQPPPSADVAYSYSPTSFQLLHYLATTIFTVHALSHVLDQQRARQRSLAAPTFGIHENEEGVVQGLGSCDPSTCVVEMEHRRKSGRATGAQFVIDHSTKSQPKGKSDVIKLLDEHPAWRAVIAEVDAGREGPSSHEQDVSFSLGLTEKQRRDREGVVLPYYDAQNSEEGPGEGGRILYEMGVEDDFDEEEDEI